MDSAPLLEDRDIFEFPALVGSVGKLKTLRLARCVSDCGSFHRGLGVMGTQTKWKRTCTEKDSCFNCIHVISCLFMQSLDI